MNISVILHYWHNIYKLTGLIVKSQYGHSKLGKIWLLLRPAFQIVIYYLIVRNVISPNTPNLPLFMLSGFIFWNIIANTLGDVAIIAGRSTILLNKPIRKSNFIFVFMLQQMIVLGMLITPVLLIAFYIYGFSGINYLAMLCLPVFIALFCACLFCMSYIMSLLFIVFQDINYFNQIAIPLLPWITPIFFPRESMGEGMLHSIQIINPLYILIRPFQEIIYYQKVPSLESWFAIILLVIFLAAILFLVRKMLNKTLVYYFK